MQLPTYLNRIGYDQPLAVTKETLFALHKAHVLQVPFENLDVIAKVPILLNQDRFYDKIVKNGRGGICYELNGAFKLLLDSIGFHSYFISCNVYVPPMDFYGADFGHIALVTTIGEEQYLVDVGFGDAFIEPLKLVFNCPQEQFGVVYRFSNLPDEAVLLEKSEDGTAFRKMFKFTLAPRQLQEFAALCTFHQEAPQAPFNKQALCTRPTPEGRLTLTPNTLTVSCGREKQEHSIASQDVFDAKLAELFNIKLQNSLI